MVNGAVAIRRSHISASVPLASDTSMNAQVSCHGTRGHETENAVSNWRRQRPHKAAGQFRTT